MKTELGSNGAIAGMLVLVFLFGGLALAIYPGWQVTGKWIARADPAAWIQAIGSIGAIFAASHIASRQAEVSRRESAARYARRMDALNGIFDQAVGVVVEIANCCDSPENAIYFVNDLYNEGEAQDVLDEFKRIDITALESADAVHYMLQLRSALISAMRAAKSLGSFDHSDFHNSDWTERNEYFEDLRERAFTARLGISEKTNDHARKDCH